MAGNSSLEPRVPLEPPALSRSLQPSETFPDDFGSISPRKAMEITPRSPSSNGCLGDSASWAEGRPSNLTTLPPEDGRELGSHQSNLQQPTQLFVDARACQAQPPLLDSPGLLRPPFWSSGFPPAPLDPPWTSRSSSGSTPSLGPAASTLEPRPSSLDPRASQPRALTLDCPLLLGSPGCS